jgi:transposase
MTLSLQQRNLILDWAEAGLNDPAISRKLGVSVHTVRKWRRRGQHQGRAPGLASQRGRPGRGAMSSFPAAMRAQFQTWRQAHPGWGPATLRAEWQRTAGLSPAHCPSTAVLSRWLKQTGAARTYERHSALPEPGPSPTQACHEEWELDACGHRRVPEIGVISLINLNDLYSRVKLASYPCWLGAERATRHPTTEDYQLVLRPAFLDWGLPERLALDHETIFYDSRSKSPYPTRFHLWLIALGVTVTFGRWARPRDQAVTERSHQTWNWQALDGQRYTTWEQLRQYLTERRTALNEWVACAALADQPPLVAHPEARQPRRTYRPEWEAAQLELSRVGAYLTQGRWFRRASNIGVVTLGNQLYGLGKDWAHTEVQITFEWPANQFVFRTPDGHTRGRPPKGLTALDLMGDAAHWLNLPSFQLALPLGPADWNRLTLTRRLTGTIL